jgi:hypothetical protein
MFRADASGRRLRRASARAAGSGSFATRRQRFFCQGPTP